MPNLRDWIEAQLKRGYSRKQIKNALIRKGYSPKAVAYVDNSNKRITTSSKKILFVVLLIIILAGSFFIISLIVDKSPYSGKAGAFDKGIEQPDSSETSQESLLALHQVYQKINQEFLPNPEDEYADYKAGTNEDIEVKGIRWIIGEGIFSLIIKTAGNSDNFENENLIESYKFTSIRKTNVENPDESVALSLAKEIFNYQDGLECGLIQDMLHCESEFTDERGNENIILIAPGVNHSTLGKADYGTLCSVSSNSNLIENGFCV